MHLPPRLLPSLCLAFAIGFGRASSGQTTPIRDSIPLTAIAAGGGFTCGLAADGRAYCWGANQHGQLGSPATPATCDVGLWSKGPCGLWPVAVSGDARFASIVTGDDHVCALTGEGEAWCWGSNLAGQLGTRDSTEVCPDEEAAKYPRYHAERCSHRPVRVAGDTRFVTLAAGRWVTCGISVDRQLYCWGDGRIGLYDEPRKGTPEPKLIPTTQRFVSMAISIQVCAVADTGGISCFDCCDQTATPDSVVPSDVQFSAIVGGTGQHFCALSRAGEAYCWGRNASGELGIASSNERVDVAVPGRVVTPQRFKALTASLGVTCGLAEDDTFSCWGNGYIVGPAATSRCHHTDAFSSCALTPVTMMNGAKVTSVSVGGMHACAIDVSGIAYCWGYNNSGEIGNGTTRYWGEPARVMGAPTSNLREFVVHDLIYFVLNGAPLIIGLVTLFTGRRRVWLHSVPGRVIVGLWLLMFFALLGTVMVEGLVRTGPGGFIVTAALLLEFELAILIVIATLYRLAIALASRVRRQSDGDLSAAA